MGVVWMVRSWVSFYASVCVSVVVFVCVFARLLVGVPVSIHVARIGGNEGAWKSA